MAKIYDPVEFVSKVEIVTIAMLGSFITWKLLNTLYDNLYEPTIEMLIQSEEADKYYLHIDKYYIQMGLIIKEFIKWLILLIVLMIVYNALVGAKW